jgi:hypothetical protein
MPEYDDAPMIPVMIRTNIGRFLGVGVLVVAVASPGVCSGIVVVINCINIES